MLGLHLNRLADITTADEEPARGRLEGALRSAPEVQVKGLGYRYSEWEPWIFRNLSFTIAPGQSVALVGPSGCGKTTLAKIVLGLIAPQEGEVTVTDQPSPVCRSAIPAEGMAAVMQDDCLFSGTIADNVTFFDSSAELSKIDTLSAIAPENKQSYCITAAIPSAGIAVHHTGWGTSLLHLGRRRLRGECRVRWETVSSQW
ncbi:ATP-binding cassette domain-containing protein, partial [Xanthomonas axonopodis]|uniref:ATP-binding cassette domain-containing protein n=1 Tax=Xanthomonas axonopodis TaxID=53413 RepID=UPI002117FEE4